MIFKDEFEQKNKHKLNKMVLHNMPNTRKIKIFFMFFVIKKIKKPTGSKKIIKWRALNLFCYFYFNYSLIF